MRTDHQALKWVSTKFKFEIEHRPGRQHGNADALSRASYRSCGTTGCKDCKNPNTYHEDSSDDALCATYAVTRGLTKCAESAAAKPTSQQPAHTVKATGQATGRLNLREKDPHQEVKDRGGYAVHHAQANASWKTSKPLEN